MRANMKTPMSHIVSSVQTSCLLACPNTIRFTLVMDWEGIKWSWHHRKTSFELVNRWC